MSVHQLPDGRWYVKHAKGKDPLRPQATRTYFGRGHEAQVKANQFNLELGLGDAKQKTGTTFAELAKDYMRAKAGTMAISTTSDTLYKIDGVITPEIGDLPASEVTPAILDQYIRTRQLAGRKLTSIHRELSIIRAIIRWGVQRRILTHNPMEGFTLPKRDDSVLVPPSEAELAAIWAAAAPHLRRAITLGYYTGMRPGASELLAIRWEHLDLINRRVFVESAKKGGMKSRNITMADGLYTAARLWLAEDMARGHQGHVIHYHGKQIERLKTAWNAAKKRAGITRRIRLYDIRHMAASTMLEAGADLKSVSEILGHSSTETTTRVYQHVNTAMRAKAIGTLGNWLPEGPEKKEE